MVFQYKTEVKWGIILGLSVSLWVFIEYLLGFHTTRISWGVYSGYVAPIVPLLCYWYGIKEKKSQLQSMRFLQGFASGLMMAMIGAVIITGFFYVYLTAVNPHYLQDELSFINTSLTTGGMNSTEVASSMQDLAELYTFTGQLFQAFLGTLIQGAIVSAGFSYMQRSRV